MDHPTFRKFIYRQLDSEWELRKELAREIRFHAGLAAAGATAIAFVAGWDDGAVSGALRRVGYDASTLLEPQNLRPLLTLAVLSAPFLLQLSCLFLAAFHPKEIRMTPPKSFREWWLRLVERGGTQEEQSDTFKSTVAWACFMMLVVNQAANQSRMKWLSRSYVCFIQLLISSGLALLAQGTNSDGMRGLHLGVAVCWPLLLKLYGKVEDGRMVSLKRELEQLE